MNAHRQPLPHSMNMQMSPASTHSLRDPPVDDHTLIWLVTRWFVTSETPAILRLSLV